MEFCDFFSQPLLKPVTVKTGVLRDFIYWKANREWRHYRKIPNVPIIVDVLRLIAQTLKKFFLTADVGRKNLLNYAVEMYITSKHTRAIEMALDHEVDYFICFEDDIIFKEDSIGKTSKLLEDLEKHSSIPVYVDLAGGCNVEELHVDALEVRKDNSFTYYSKPVTNTVCCYLINLEQMKRLDYFLTRTPLVRYMNFDWCLNKLLIEQDKVSDIKTYCIHTSPTFFKHGSVTGERKAWKN